MYKDGPAKEESHQGKSDRVEEMKALNYRLDKDSI